MAHCWAWHGAAAPLLSSPPWHGPTAPCPTPRALLGATGCVLGTRKEQQPCQGSTMHCLWVLDPSCSSSCPSFPGSLHVLSWQGPTGPWSPTLKQVPIEEQPHSLGVLSTLLSPALEALEKQQLPKPQGQWWARPGGSSTRIPWKSSGLSTHPAGAPQGLLLLRVPALAPSATWLPHGACECSFN